ncbi:hypothetical protein ACQCT5_16170 [Sutcliffiella halmapala]
MDKKTVYFSDNFFSSGETDIYTENKKVVGVLDLRSAFSSKVDVKTPDGEIVVSGAFAFFSNRWVVSNHREAEIGQLRKKMAFFKSVYEYHTNDRGVFRLENPAFSKEFTLYHPNENLAAHFKRINGFFESSAFELTNLCSDLSTEELVAVVMGMNEIKKREATQSNSAT